MKTVLNNIIPFKGFIAINLFGIVFIRKDAWARNKYKQITYNHEEIHTYQMKELWYIFFYIIYLFEYLFYLIKYRNSNKAYYSISFEREAFKYEWDLNYLKTRKKFSQWKH